MSGTRAGRCFFVLTLMGELSMCLCHAAGDSLPVDAKVIASGINTSQFVRPCISPDGTRLVFVRGAELCLYDFGDGSVRAIESAGSFYDLIKDPAVDFVELSFEAAVAGRQEGNLLQQNAAFVFGSMSALTWTQDSGAVICSTSPPQNPPSKLRNYYLRTIRGNLRLLGKLPGSPRASRNHWQVNREQSRLVLDRGRERPLIWDLIAQRPVATPYTILVASTTSDRWIGVEKDSRRFVVLDKHFRVLNRTPFTAPSSQHERGRELKWSPNERFVLYRHQVGFDHYDNWMGIWLDLESGAQQALSGLVFHGDQLDFTGNGGAWISLAAIGSMNEGISGYRVFGHVIERHGMKNNVTWRWRERWDPTQSRRPAFVPDHSFTRFAVLDLNSATYELSLLDRHHAMHPLATMDASSAASIIGFAHADQEIVMQRGHQLVSLPVPPINEPEERADATIR